LGWRKKEEVSKVVIGDADSLIALVYKDDANHLRAQKISGQLLSEGYQIIYPSTAIVEAITTLKRSLNLSKEAHIVNQQYQRGVFHVEYFDNEVMVKASHIFDKVKSKKNTFFDCLVAATAENLEADAIFSFDKWYPKLGLKLISL
jgi:predicted nucleic acid-binding protein